MELSEEKVAGAPTNHEAATTPGGASKSESRKARPVLLIGALAVAVAAFGGLWYYHQTKVASAANALIPTHLPTLPKTTASSTNSSTGSSSSVLPTSANATPTTATGSQSVTPTTLSASQLTTTKNPFTPLVSTSSSSHG